jgi:hypothetical protein
MNIASKIDEGLHLQPAATSVRSQQRSCFSSTFFFTTKDYTGTTILSNTTDESQQENRVEEHSVGNSRIHCLSIQP